MEYSQGVDVFVTEGQVDTPTLLAMKWGTPEFMTKFTVDTYHTPFYAAGYMFNQINPRLGMITHTNYEDELMGESVAEVRAHWKGLFMFGAPDVNGRQHHQRRHLGTQGSAARRQRNRLDGPQSDVPARPTPPEKLRMPDPVRPREMQQEQFLRDMEIEPDDFYPPDANREVERVWPEEGVELDVKTLLRAKGVEADDE